MKKIVFFFMLLAFVMQACEKELSRAINDEDQPQVIVDPTPDEGVDSTNTDSTDNLEDLAEIEKNEHSVYSFGGVRGTYFGCMSSFKGKKDVNLAITLGTNLTKGTYFTQQEFEHLIRTGKREFGSLGAFSSYPALDSGRVEISYTDKDNRRWCSTQITERNSDHGTETVVKIEQKKAVFTIGSVHKVEIGAEREGYRLKGYFDCTLYEVNGKAKKKIKGNFSGIVAPK